MKSSVFELNARPATPKRIKTVGAAEPLQPACLEPFNHLPGKLLCAWLKMD